MTPPADGDARGAHAAPRRPASVAAPRRVLRDLRETFEHWSDNGAPLMGAGLAFYAVFSIVPLLLVVISLAALLVGPEAARGEVFAQLRLAMGDDAARTIEGWLRESNRERSGIRGVLIGTAVSLVGATTLFAHLQSSLDRLWVRQGEAPPASGSMIRVRLQALAMVGALGALMMVAMLAGAAFSAVAGFVAPLVGTSERVLRVADFALGLLLTVALCALVFRVVPRARIGWRAIWAGALFTAVLVALGRVAIGWYLSTADVASGYGAAGSLVLVLLWVYYTAQVFLFGAQWTWVRSGRAARASG